MYVSSLNIFKTKQNLEIMATINILTNNVRLYKRISYSNNNINHPSVVLVAYKWFCS